MAGSRWQPPRGERGQTSVEHAGVVAVVVALLLALVVAAGDAGAAAGGTLRRLVCRAASAVDGSPCPAGAAARPLPPAAAAPPAPPVTDTGPSPSPTASPPPGGAGKGSTPPATPSPSGGTGKGSTPRPTGAPAVTPRAAPTPGPTRRPTPLPRRPPRPTPSASPRPAPGPSPRPTPAPQPPPRRGTPGEPPATETCVTTQRDDSLNFEVNAHLGRRPLGGRGALHATVTERQRSGGAQPWEVVVSLQGDAGAVLDAGVNYADAEAGEPTAPLLWGTALQSPGGIWKFRTQAEADAFAAAVRQGLLPGGQLPNQWSDREGGQFFVNLAGGPPGVDLGGNLTANGWLGARVDPTARTVDVLYAADQTLWAFGGRSTESKPASLTLGGNFLATQADILDVTYDARTLQPTMVRVIVDGKVGSGPRGWGEVGLGDQKLTVVPTQDRRHDRIQVQAVLDLRDPANRAIFDTWWRFKDPISTALLARQFADHGTIYALQYATDSQAWEGEANVEQPGWKVGPKLNHEVENYRLVGAWYHVQGRSVLPQSDGWRRWTACAG